MTGGSKSKNTSRRTSDKAAKEKEKEAAAANAGPAHGEEGKIPAKRLSPEQEARLISTTGFSRTELYNRRGWHSERGLATLLESGDTIEEIHPTHVVIRTAEGTRQTIYNLDKETPFLKRLPE